MIDTMTAIQERYKVTLRTKNQTVRHQAYGTETEVSPEQFAVYEAALKAMYIHQFVTYCVLQEWRRGAGTVAYFGRMMGENDIVQPWIKDDEITEATARQASKDYIACQRWIEEAGLYYELLD